MGWIESTHIFCAASKIARDVGQHLLEKDHLLKYKLEHLMMPNNIQQCEDANVKKLLCS